MKLKFEYYLHDNYNSEERADIIGKEIGVKFTDEMAEDMGRPFYEVGLECEYDTATGQVTILGLMT
jgi:hypothetical protein